ncbi:tetratricopeptide repeat protein [Streptomyces sp. NBC_00572]|uniref:ATP-binding protein n=1 Tax=Streptomyces sp. NBC_00572 TaxID=2903664 RepID=UPI00224CC286|nr:tetratricopeptide repeat protein [Streptomyces sp. NBC_00572]MCX4985356.1 tetratricopeptide repeat protein [Streptomyces sp. NBC_00572]
MNADSADSASSAGNARSAGDADNGSNAFAGRATHVVQAGVIYGGVHGGRDAPSVPTLPVPRQLPRVATCFTDRTDLLAALNAVAATSNGVAMISGTAGVGKSALAVHWGHQARDLYPDGQLYANLRGYDRLAPLAPEEVLHGFLSALGAPADRVPGSLDAMSSLFRSLLDGKRVLLVADNAGSADQVRPLLPSAPGCFTIVTSRSRLGALTAVDGATPVAMRPLDTPDAVELFRRLAGDDEAEGVTGDGVTRLVRRCGRLPLTVRIAAQQAGAGTSLGELIEELEGDGLRLESLSMSDERSGVRTVFSWSYQQLTPAGARAFRLLALHAGPDFSVPTAAALIDLPEAQTRRLLRDLVAVNMLEAAGPRRYGFHDLLRDYARERVEAEEPPEARAQALGRELSHYLRMADAADRVLVPERQHVPLERHADGANTPFPGPEAALAWCDSELPSLVPAVGQAVELGLDDVAWKLPVALVYFLRLRRHDTHRRALSDTAVRAARRLDDQWAETWSLICVAGAESDMGLHEDAMRHFTEALRISQAIGDSHWQANSIYNIAWTLRLMGRYEEALERQREALPIHRSIGDRRGEAITRTEMAASSLALGRPTAAFQEYERALDGARVTADLPTQAKSLHGLGDVCRTVGRTDEAIGWYEQAVDVRRRVGDLLGLARSLDRLAEQLVTVGRAADAQEALVEAVAILDSLGNPMAEEVRLRLVAFDHGTEPGDRPADPLTDGV